MDEMTIDKYLRNRYEKVKRFYTLCRRFNQPKYLLVRLSTRKNAHSTTLLNLLETVGMPAEKIKEVFEFDVQRQGFNGRFVDGGKQKLSDLLNKEIEYHNASYFDGVLVDIKREVCSPRGE